MRRIAYERYPPSPVVPRRSRPIPQLTHKDRLRIFRNPLAGRVERLADEFGRHAGLYLAYGFDPLAPWLIAFPDPHNLETVTRSIILVFGIDCCGR